MTELRCTALLNGQFLVCHGVIARVAFVEPDLLGMWCFDSHWFSSLCDTENDPTIFSAVQIVLEPLVKSLPTTWRQSLTSTCVGLSKMSNEVAERYLSVALSATPQTGTSSSSDPATRYFCYYSTSPQAERIEACFSLPHNNASATECSSHIPTATVSCKTGHLPSHVRLLMPRVSKHTRLFARLVRALWTVNVWY